MAGAVNEKKFEYVTKDSTVRITWIVFLKFHGEYYGPVCMILFVSSVLTDWNAELRRLGHVHIYWQTLVWKPVHMGVD